MTAAAPFTSEIRDGRKRQAHKGNGGDSETRSTEQNKLLNIEALSTMTFPPIKYVVPGVIVEGLTLFAGKPKIGKSWLVLHAAVGVGRGGFTLGHLKCKEGDVLYCALEDNARRLQSRLTKLLGLPPWDVKRVDFLCEMPRLVAAMNARTLARSSSVIQAIGGLLSSLTRYGGHPSLLRGRRAVEPMPAPYGATLAS